MVPYTILAERRNGRTSAQRQQRRRARVAADLPPPLGLARGLERRGLGLVRDRFQAVRYHFRRLRRPPEGRFATSQDCVAAARLPPERGPDGIADYLAAR